MSKILDLLTGLAANATTKDVTATNTQALDDNTKKLLTTEGLLNQFTASAKRLADSASVFALRCSPISMR